MKEEKESYSYIHLEPTFPHKLLLCMKEIRDGKTVSLNNGEEYLKFFHESFPDCTDEWNLLKIAYEQNVIRDFLEADKKSYWQKRVTIKKTFFRLLKALSERDAAVILESLMFVLRWEFFIKIERKWDTGEDERAEFHEKMQIDPAQKTAEIPFARGDFAELEISREQVDFSRNDMAEHGVFRKEDAQAFVILPDSAAEKEKTEDLSDKRESDEEQKGENDAKKVLEQRSEEVKFYQMMNLSERRVLKRALGGDTVSQCEMGAYYADPSGRHQDYQEAIRWYEVAAEGGVERAFFEIGRIYDINGTNIAGGKDKALKIYKKLAVQGYPTAQCVLGMKYRLGDGVEENLEEAVSWLEKAAVQGHDAAIRNLVDLYRSIGEQKKAGRWDRIGNRKWG